MTVFNISFIENGIGQANLCKAETAEQARAYFESIAPDAEIINVSVNNECYKPGKPCHEVPAGWTAMEETAAEVSRMKFTQEELVSISNGILALIRNAGEAKKLVNSEETLNAIEQEVSDLVSLNSKICHMMKE